MSSREQPVVRRGTVSWLTHSPDGRARVKADSKAFRALPVSFPEVDPVPGEATPGELLAISHAILLAGFLADELDKAGTPANERSPRWRGMSRTGARPPRSTGDAS